MHSPFIKISTRHRPRAERGDVRYQQSQERYDPLFVIDKNKTSIRSFNANARQYPCTLITAGQGHLHWWYTQIAPKHITR